MLFIILLVAACVIFPAVRHVVRVLTLATVQEARRVYEAAELEVMLNGLERLPAPPKVPSDMRETQRPGRKS